MYCYQCGKEFHKDEKVCPYCGVDNPRFSEKSSSATVFTLSNKQVIWLIICCLWISVFLIGKALDYEKYTFYVVTFGVPIVITLLLLLFKKVKENKRYNNRKNEIALPDFMKEYDSVRIDKISNKYTGDISQYMVFSKEIRASFDESIHDFIIPEEFSKIKDSLIVRKRGEDKYIITRTH